MRLNGWMRLWIVASCMAIPTLGILEFERDAAVWQGLDAITVRLCVDAEDRPPHEDGLKCIHRQGADRTYFQHEQITPLSYWSRSFVILLLLDIILSGIAFLTGRWVYRGFKPKPVGR